MIVNLLNKLIQVSEGGTGANNAADALANLGGVEIVQAKGAEYDMDAILKGGSHFKIYSTNKDTLGTPYNKGVSNLSASVIISFSSSTTYGKQIAIVSGGKITFERRLNGGEIGDWYKVITSEEPYKELSVYNPTPAIKDMAQYIRYYPYLNMCHMNIIFTNLHQVDAGEIIDIGFTPEGYKPNSQQTLTIYAGASKVSCFVTTDGKIHIKAYDNIAIGESINITGWWQVESVQLLSD